MSRGVQMRRAFSQVAPATAFEHCASSCYPVGHGALPTTWTPALASVLPCRRHRAHGGSAQLDKWMANMTSLNHLWVKDAFAHAGKRLIHIQADTSDTNIDTSQQECMLHVKKKRMDALIESEIVHFSRALEPHTLTLPQILAHRDEQTLRLFLLEELPIRFAKRLDLIEKKLPTWQSYPQTRFIRSLYSDAFRRLRMVPSDDPEKFRGVLSGIKRRTSNMLMHVVKGIWSMKQNQSDIDAKEIDCFLDTFLTARIGTDVLSSQYLAITRPDSPTSVIDPECDTVEVVRKAADDARRLCQYHYKFAPVVVVQCVGEVRFPFIPQYLNYIMFELIKNSLRAVAERYDSEKTVSQHPIRIIVAGDEDTIVIRVCDEGGGIPLDALPKVWSYLYTTAKPQTNEYAGSDYDSDDEGVAPMAGFGCGLPLSRNYASYVGGRLELNSLPYHGTNAYLYFNRMGDPQKASSMTGLPCRGILPR